MRCKSGRSDARSSARSCLMLGSWSGAGGYVWGEDVAGVAVEVLGGSVVAHCGARVGVAGGDLDVAQVCACVERGCDERVPERRGMCPGDPDAGGSGTRAALPPCRRLAGPVAVFFAEVADVRAGGLEDPQEGVRSVLGAPGQIAAQIGAGVVWGSALEPGKVGGRREPQPVSSRDQGASSRWGILRAGACTARWRICWAAGPGRRRG
jgi:hypothetical protein